MSDPRVNVLGPDGRPIHGRSASGHLTRRPTVREPHLVRESPAQAARLWTRLTDGESVVVVVDAHVRHGEQWLGVQRLMIENNQEFLVGDTIWARPIEGELGEWAFLRGERREVRPRFTKGGSLA